jgi:hypothetical protein
VCRRSIVDVQLLVLRLCVDPFHVRIYPLGRCQAMTATRVDKVLRGMSDFNQDWSYAEEGQSKLTVGWYWYIPQGRDYGWKKCQDQSDFEVIVLIR